MASLLGDKLQKCLNEKNCYEAHQIYRTMYFRLVRVNKLVEAYDQMYEGAIHMFDLNEPLSGIDLGGLVLDLLNKDEAGKTVLEKKGDVVYSNLSTLFERIPSDSQDRDVFIAKTLNTPCLASGKTLLRTKLANLYWKESNYVQARKHFLHSSEPGDKVAKFLIEFQVSKSIPEEIDLFIAQFVLQCLVLKHFDLGRSTFFNYVEKHPQIGQNKPKFVTPLLNFIYYLLEARNEQKNEAELPKTFMALCNLYSSSIDQDPDFHKYLETIGHNYFGMPKPAKNNDDNPLANLMKSLLGDSAGPAGPPRPAGQNPLMQLFGGPSRPGPPRPAQTVQNPVQARPRPPVQHPADDDLD